MPKLPALKPRDVEKLLRKHGFVLSHTTGSHKQYFNPESSAHVTIPFHLKDLAKGTLHSIIHQSKLPIDTFKK